MWRYFAGAAAALMLVAGGLFFFRGTATPTAANPLAAPSPSAQVMPPPLPDAAPEADARTREQKRFDRIDKNRDGTITRDEYFALRHKLFAKMDVDHDGKLSFDEWAFRGIDRFNQADKDKSGTLDRAEFATTALKRKAKPKCACGKPAPASPPREENSDDE